MAEPDTTNRRPVVIGVAVVAIAAIIAGLVFVAVSGDDVEDAGERTSDTPSTFDDTGTRGTTDTEPDDGTDLPTGEDPAIGLEPVADLPGVSAVVDLDGDGPVLASTLDGRIHELDLDSGDSEVVLDLSGQISFGGEQGLLGMVADPGEQRLYVNYSDSSGDTDVRSWPLVDGRPEGGPSDGVVHLELGQPFSNHNGGHLTFGPEGLLWIGTGDGGGAGDPQEVAQDPSSLLGKMLRVAPNPDGGVQAPDSNPAWDGRPEIWGIGLRNPWRYSFDRETDQLWVADVGQGAVEEVTVVAPDAELANFGWDDVEGDQDFEGSAAPAFLAPQITYGHDADGGCSITGGYVYRGDDIESLHGWYLFGDFCGGWIRAVPADDADRDPVELVSGAGGAITFAQLDDGELLFATESGLSRVVGP
ncbi:MAG: PQQ-dependent sugar dehydrogenase [Acidimicrobiales bacterium]|nr:PQQ-dependent sugar dehydrogenase [Acidimicrobiales bacterium]